MAFIRFALVVQCELDNCLLRDSSMCCNIAVCRSAVERRVCSSVGSSTQQKMCQILWHAAAWWKYEQLWTTFQSWWLQRHGPTTKQHCHHHATEVTFLRSLDLGQQECHPVTDMVSHVLLHPYRSNAENAKERHPFCWNAVCYIIKFHVSA